jgi:hypothetical protein
MPPKKSRLERELASLEWTLAPVRAPGAVDGELALALHLQAEEYGQEDQLAHDEALAMALHQELDDQANGVPPSKVHAAEEHAAEEHAAEEHAAGESHPPSPDGPDVLAPLRAAVLSKDFVRAIGSFSDRYRLLVELNEFSEPGSPLFEKFVARLGAVSPDALVCVGFHGTAEGNISPILREGLDPRRRGTHGQAHGPGEYFAKDPHVSVSYCSSTSGYQHSGKMVVFLLLLEPHERRKWDSGVVVVQRSDHQMPLGVLHFNSAEEELRKERLEEERRKEIKERRAALAEADAKEARNYARVVAMYLKGDYGEASDFFKQCWKAEEQPKVVEKHVADRPIPPAPVSPPRAPWIASPFGFGGKRVEFVHAVKVGDLLARRADPQDAPTPPQDAPMPPQPVAPEDYEEKPKKMQEKAKAADGPEAKEVQAAPKVPPVWVSDLTRWMLDADGAPYLDTSVMDFLFPGVRGAFGKPRVFNETVEELERRAKELRTEVEKDKDLAILAGEPGPEALEGLSQTDEPGPVFPTLRLGGLAQSLSARTRRSRSRSPRGANQLRDNSD